MSPATRSDRAGRQTAASDERRFVRRRWARRWSNLRLVLVGVLLLALVVGAAWVVLESRLLGVDRVEVSGTRLLDDDRVRRTAGVPDGEPLARVDVDAVRRRVETLAAVAEVDVSKAWPHAVRIVVTEREAVAAVQVGRSWRGTDRDGVLFRTFDTAPGSLPRIRLGEDVRREALAEAATVAGSLPDSLRPVVRYVTVRTVDDISLALSGGRTVVWGSAERSEDKAEVLRALLKARKAGTYDVSVPGRPTTSD